MLPTVLLPSRPFVVRLATPGNFRYRRRSSEAATSGHRVSSAWSEVYTDSSSPGLRAKTTLN